MNQRQLDFLVVANPVEEHIARPATDVGALPACFNELTTGEAQMRVEATR